MDDQTKTKLTRYLAYFCLVLGGINALLAVALTVLGDISDASPTLAPAAAGLIAGVVLLKRTGTGTDG